MKIPVKPIKGELNSFPIYFLKMDKNKIKYADSENKNEISLFSFTSYWFNRFQQTVRGADVTSPGLLVIEHGTTSKLALLFIQII